MVARLIDVMNAVPDAQAPPDMIASLARAYLDFALDNRLMWNLLFTHQAAAPVALIDNIKAVGAIVTRPVAELVPTASASASELAAKALWAGIHGVTAIAVTDKGPPLNPATAHVLVEQLVSTYTRGLTR